MYYLNATYSNGHRETLNESKLPMTLFKIREVYKTWMPNILMRVEPQPVGYWQFEDIFNEEKN